MEKDFFQNPQLEGEPFYWQNNPTGILLIHGFTATTAEVRPLAKYLHQQGFSVAGPLLPGHYTNPEDLNRVQWMDWVETVETAYEHMKSQCEKVIVGGESTGGLLALYLAAHHPEISAVLLYAPALQLTLPKIMVFWLYLIAPFMPWITPKQGKPTASSERWQGYKVRPLKGLIQLLKLQKQIQPLLGKIDQPTLIIQGRLDMTVHPDVPDLIGQRISSPVKKIHWMENSTHCVILDCEIEDVFEITHEFILSNLS